MRKLYAVVATLLVLSLTVFPVLDGCTVASTGRLKVVTSTSLLALAVEEVGGGLVEVENIVPGAQHPGDFDARPGAIRLLADADLFLYHGWPGETFVPGLLDSADNPDITVVKIDIAGNWMTPPAQREAAERVAAALSQLDPANSAVYQKGAAAFLDRATAVEAAARQRLDAAGVSRVNALVSFWQADFARWVGLNVVATYGNPETLTPPAVKELVDKGRQGGVSLIIDNLQSGKDAAAAVAGELGCRRINLSNFPGGLDDTDTWEKAFNRNIGLILEAVTGA